MQFILLDGVGSQQLGHRMSFQYRDAAEGAKKTPDSIFVHVRNLSGAMPGSVEKRWGE